MVATTPRLFYPDQSYGGDLRPLTGVPSRSSSLLHIAIAHGFLINGEHDANYIFQITKDDIADTNRDYVVLGHWFRTACVCETPVKAYYSGSATETGTAFIIDFTTAEGLKVTPCQPPLA